MSDLTNQPSRSPGLKVLIYSLAGANIAIITGFWWHGTGHLFGHGTANSIIIFARLCGLIGADSIILEFLTMSRLPILETALGRAYQVKLHKWLGYLAFIAILLHFSLLTIGYSLVSGKGLISQFLYFWSNFEDVYQAVIAVLLLVAVVVLSVWIVRRHLKYETWFYAHLLSYLVILLAFQHQWKNGADFLSQPLFVYYWWGLYILTFLLVVGFRFVKPLLLSLSRDLRVEKVADETHDTHSVYVTGRDLANLKFSGGQFAIWRFMDNRRWWQGHPFSLSQGPGKNTLRLTFKESGDFTAELAKLQPGTRVILDGPYGVFSAEAVSRPKILMIAGGIGITPLASMLPEVAAKTADIVLLYSARNESDLALKSELEGYSQQFGTKITYIISDDPAYKGITGRLDQAKLKQLVPDAADRQIFLCGPPPMMKAISSALQNLGVPKSMINTEDFSF